MDNIDFSALFTTKLEANDFVARLASISDMFFKTGFNLEKALAQQFGVNKSDRILAIMREREISPESLPAAKDFLFALATKIPTIPVLSLTIAFPPQEQTLQNLSEWFLVNMNKQMLFEITVDRNLVGGATITFSGKFFDYSIRSTFERVMKDNLARLDTEEAKRLGPQRPSQQPSAATQTPTLRQIEIQRHTANPAPAQAQATAPTHGQPQLQTSAPIHASIQTPNQAPKQDINNITIGR